MKRLSFILLSFVLFTTAPAFAESKVMSIYVDHGVPLALTKPAASVFVANPEIADVQVLSPMQLMLFGKRTGETTFMATDDKGGVLAERTLVVSQDLTDLRAELVSAIPGNEIKAKAVPNGIVLTGSARDNASVADAYKIAMRYLPQGGDIINRIQVTGSNQIQIRVRFAEVQRSIDNSLGFNWQNIFANGPFTVGLATGNGVRMAGSGIFNSGAANNTGLFPRPNNTSLSTPNNVLGEAFHSGHWEIDSMIDALAQDGFLTILAEPNLTAMSGETANFLAGGQFPIPVPQGNGTISIQFQSYGISLAFTPTVLSGDRISLHVRPEVSELTDAGAIVASNITVPALTTRKAETTVEVASGESFAIAGLIGNNQSQTVNKFPGLGDLPVIGALFRSDHFVNGQSELVVIITPYIVKPSKHPLTAPTDGYAPPTDPERLLGGRYSTANANARPVSGDPVAVRTEPEPAPVLPVSAAPIEEKAIPVPPLPSAAPKAPAAKVAPALPPPAEPEAAPAPVSAPAAVSAPQAVAAPKPVETALPSVPPPAPKPPLVLHPSSDADKHNGGLLVE